MSLVNGFRVGVGALCCAALLVGSCFAEQQSSPAAVDTAALAQFLRNYFDPTPALADSTTKYSFASADLNNDSVPEVIVYVMGRRRCGSGGCPTLILESEGASFKVITKITLTWLPIRVLPEKTNGWHDLSVSVAGGGSESSAALLTFDGKKYPTNSTTVPAIPKKIVTHEGTLPLKYEGELLYPK